jgi:integrase
MRVGGVFMRVTETKPPVFTGVYAELLDKFVKHKQALGYKYFATAEILTMFDKFSDKYDVQNYELTKQIVSDWIEKRPYEQEETRKTRAGAIRQFAIYLNELGYSAYICQKQKYRKIIPFTPYIFTNNELKRIFNAADNSKFHRRHKNSHISTPVIMRLLYGCGLRVSEAVKLRICDVDMENKVLTIRHSKFDKDRLVPISESLSCVFENYIKEMPSYKETNDYFFYSENPKNMMTKGSVYSRFRNLLMDSGISHGGRGKGPRLHDLRHTFSVHVLQKFISQGIDITCALPYLAVYLGHTNISMTHKYLRLTSECYPEITALVEKTCGKIYEGVKG